MEMDNTRLNFARNKLNIKHTINPLEENGFDKLKSITQNEMPTVVVDATGNQKAINSGLQYLAHGGKYILIGLQKGELIFSHPEFHKRETTLMSSRNANRLDFEWVIEHMKNGQMGFKVPTDKFRFIFTSNLKLPTSQDPESKKKKIAIKDFIVQNIFLNSLEESF